MPCTKALASDADVILVMLGSNDAKVSCGTLDAAAFQAEYLSLIESLVAMPRSPRVIVMSPPPALRPRARSSAVRTMMPPPPPPHPSKADLLADGWTFHGAGSSSATDGAADRKEKPGELVMEGSHGDLAQELCASGMLALPHVLAVMEASRSNAVVQLQGCRGMSMLAEREETRQQLIAKV